MTKTLKDFLEVYKPKSPDEQKFVDKHVVIKHKDRNGNGDDVFKATNIKTNKRKEERHGYDVGEDEKVYEELKGSQHKIDANKNGKVDAHDFKLLRKKKVAEEAEDVEEARIYTDDYEVTSEKSQFGGHRPKVVHKEKGHTMFLGQHAYKKPATAVKHGEAYLSAYATRGDNAAQNASFDFARANKKHLYVKEDIDAVLDEALDLLMSIDEKTLTPAEMKKREEVVKAIKRDDPKMDKSMAYAIATKTAKRVAEGTMPTADEPTDDNKKMAQKVRDLLAKEKKPVKEEAEDLDESAKIAAHLIKRYGDNVRKSHVRSAANDFGVDASKLAKAVRTKLGKTSLAEEEQIDELSAETKASYVKKASGEIDKLYDKSKTDARSAYKYYGRKNTMRKIANEEVEEIDEISKATMGRYINKAKDSIDMAAYRQGGVEARGSSSRPLEKKLTKRHKGISMAVNKLTKEEADSLEELSVAKLKDYRTKARADAYDADDVDDERRYRKRAAGSNTAGKKIVRQGGSLRAEEAEGLDELSKGKMLDYMDKASDARGHRNLSTKKVDNRYAGVKKASDKLTKEEVEAIDELSKKTLGSYTYQAASQLGSRGITTGLKIAADEPTEKNFKKMGNRQKGVAMAVKRLTKEDVINRAVEKYVPEELKFTPEERLLKRINGLSEAHVGTILGLFEALNKDNQNKMIETVETREGINQILNFVLENRGK